MAKNPHVPKEPHNAKGDRAVSSGLSAVCCPLRGRVVLRSSHDDLGEVVVVAVVSVMST